MCADPNPSRHAGSHHGQRGLSLIELMVGIVVALLVGLAATAGAVFFTASQRQGMGTSATATNVTATLSAIKEDVAQVGLGFFGDSAYLCGHLNLSRGAADLTIDDFSPLRVQRADHYDALDVLYANNVAGGANVRLAAAATGEVELKSFLPALEGDAVLLAPEPGGADPRCTVRSATLVTPATPLVSLQTISFDDTGLHNRVSFASPVAYGVDDRVALLGRLAWRRYRVDDTGRLVLERVLANESAVLVRNVVGFRVQYGITDAPTPGAAAPTTITAWANAEGAWASLTAANLARVRALRIGIVARSAQPEKRNRNGKCEATETAPELFGAAVTALPKAWRCYRYRTALVTVPLRNIAVGLR